ncbi:DUF6463 family protein [Nonomuraea indica]|uniref:DUF6463 family protein n=1 Tax=Nonomuraea indica TaxID=1581193 RepID=A0ABW8A393_9ACTN|nr:DUF6463 family protein [Nonomuraea indica]
MNALTRWVPRLIIALAIVHFAYALATPNAWSAMAGDGFWASAADSDASDYYEREFTLYFFAAGILLLALGTLARRFVHIAGHLPGQIGWYLIISGALLCVIEFPITGGWLMVAIGVLGLIASRRTSRTREADIKPART